MDKIIILIFIALAGGVLCVARLQPKSLAALEAMDREERRAYLARRETSEVVGYYCGETRLPPAVERDVAKSLRDEHGVTSCTANGRRREIPRSASR